MPGVLHSSSVELFFPIRLTTLENDRLPWQAKARKAKIQRAHTKLFLDGKRKPVPELPVVVTFTRFGRRKLDPGNLEACFKHLQDGVADWLGVDDGDREKVAWLYRQKITGAKTAVSTVYGCNILIESRALMRDPSELLGSWTGLPSSTLRSAIEKEPWEPDPPAKTVK